MKLSQLHEVKGVGKKIKDPEKQSPPYRPETMKRIAAGHRARAQARRSKSGAPEQPDIETPEDFVRACIAAHPGPFYSPEERQKIHTKCIRQYKKATARSLTRKTGRKVGQEI